MESYVSSLDCVLEFFPVGIMLVYFLQLVSECSFTSFSIPGILSAAWLNLCFCFLLCRIWFIDSLIAMIFYFFQDVFALSLETAIFMQTAGFLAPSADSLILPFQGLDWFPSSVCPCRLSLRLVPLCWELLSSFELEEFEFTGWGVITFWRCHIPLLFMLLVCLYVVLCEWIGLDFLSNFVWGSLEWAVPLWSPYPSTTQETTGYGSSNN